MRDHVANPQIPTPSARALAYSRRARRGYETGNEMTIDRNSVKDFLLDILVGFALVAAFACAGTSDYYSMVPIEQQRMEAGANE